MQMFNMPYAAPYPQQQNVNHWPTTQPVIGSTGDRSQPMYNPCMGTPVAPANAYGNQVSYPAQPRESQVDVVSSGQMLLPMQRGTQGAAYGSTPGHMAGREYYLSEQLHSSGHESTPRCTRTQCMHGEAAEGEVVARAPGPMGQGMSQQRREIHPGDVAAISQGMSCPKERLMQAETRWGAVWSPTKSGERRVEGRLHLSHADKLFMHLPVPTHRWKEVALATAVTP